MNSLIACLALSLAIITWPARAAGPRQRLLSRPVYYLGLALSVGLTLWLILLTLETPVMRAVI
jgi:hypothetical protein